MSSKIRLGFDIYSATGIIVLVVASAVLMFLVISNWGLMAMGSNRVYYLVAMLVASAVPLAMLVLYIMLNIRPFRGARIVFRSRGTGMDNNKEIGEGSTTNEQLIGSAIREVEIKDTATESEQKKPEAQVQTTGDKNVSMENARQIDIEGVVREEVAKATASFVSKIDSFSQDVQGIRRELEEIKNTVESAMIDIRSLLSEISNPFNYLRRFTTETDIRELGLSVSSDVERGGTITSTIKTAQPAGKPVGRGGDKNNEQGSVVSVESVNTEEFSRELAEIFSKGVSVSKIMRIIMFVGDNIQVLGKDGLLGIVELGVSSGVIPKESMDIVAKVVSLIESTKVPPKRLAVTLHKLAKSIGIADKEAEFLAMALSEG